MRYSSSFVVLLALAGCAPHVELVDVDPATATRQKAEVRMLSADDLTGRDHDLLGRFIGTSCWQSITCVGGGVRLR